MKENLYHIIVPKEDLISSKTIRIKLSNVEETFFKVLGWSKYKTNYFDMQQIKIESLKN